MKNLYIIITILFCFGTPTNAQARLRNIEPGEQFPAFSLKQIDGKTVDSAQIKDKIVVLTYINISQDRSQKAARDILKIAKLQQKKPNSAQFFFISTTLQEKNTLLQLQKDTNIPILVDEKYELWGEIGGIALPLVIIIDANNKLIWSKAGYGPDFENLVQEHLKNAKKGEISIKKEEKVAALTNNTALAKVKRHQKMAEMFEANGKFDLALDQLEKAKNLIPESTTVIFPLAEMLCRVNKGQQALEVIKEIKAQDRLSQGRVKFISGWAHHINNNILEAETLLKEALQLNPNITRAYYELGKICENKGQIKEAVAYYRKALAIIYDDSEFSQK